MNRLLVKINILLFEGVTNPFSCTILIKGPNEYSISQIKDAIRDGLRAVKNVFDDGYVLPGAGAFEIGCHSFLIDYARNEVEGKTALGVHAFADALLSIPKAIAENAGQDPQQAVLTTEKRSRDNKTLMGIDISNGEALNPLLHGIIDNYCVKKTFLYLGPVLVQQLLLVDEVMRAGKQIRKGDE